MPPHEIIPWKEMAQSMGYQTTEIMLRHRYLVKRQSLRILAEELGVAMQSLRMKLIFYGIKLRPRGGKNR